MKPKFKIGQRVMHKLRRQGGIVIGAYQREPGYYLVQWSDRTCPTLCHKTNIIPVAEPNRIWKELNEN
jgi:hypothetical protein